MREGGEGGASGLGRLEGLRWGGGGWRNKGRETRGREGERDRREGGSQPGPASRWMHNNVKLKESTFDYQTFTILKTSGGPS